jgi:hypothetical protein
MTKSLLSRYGTGLFSIGLALVALLVLTLARPSLRQITDNRQVSYAYVAQLRAGNGLVFNPDEHVLLTASPAYLLLLGLLGRGITIPQIVQSADWLFALSIAIGVYSLYRLARHAALPVPLAVVVAALYSLGWPLWVGFGTSFPLMTALCLLALDLALNSRWQLAGLILSAAILCSPEAFLLAIPLLLLAMNRGAARRFILSLLIPLALAVMALRVYYGPSLWDGLLILKPSSSTLSNALPWLVSLPIVVLAAWGWYRERSREIVAVVGAWAMLHLLIIGGLLRVQAGWQYAPLAGAVLLLAAVGLQRLSPAVRRGGYAMIAALVAASTLSAVQALAPLEGIHSAEPFSSIGVMSTAQALNLSRSPDQTVIAFDGQLQPDLKAIIERGDIQSMLIRYAPDILITTDTGRIPAQDLASGAWARLDYRLIENPNTYRRYSQIGNFVAQRADIPYGPDIRLVGYALDQPSLRPGQLVRVRLDWILARPASKPITVDLWLESGDYVFAHATDEFASSIFEAGQWSTYHTLVVDRAAWPGVLTLRVGLIVSDGVVERAGVTKVNLTP